MYRTNRRSDDSMSLFLERNKRKLDAPNRTTNQTIINIPHTVYDYCLSASVCIWSEQK